MSFPLICTRPLAALVFALGLSLSPLPAAADEKAQIAALANALSYAQAGDWTGATSAAAGAGGTGADVIEWQRLRAAQGNLGDYESFLARHPDWPGLPLLKEKGEPRLAGVDPARVIAYFGTDLPRTAAGSLALVAAYDATGQRDRAAAEAFRAWTTLKFTTDQEVALLTNHPEVEAKGDIPRLDAILWDGDRVDEAQRMLPRVSKAWAALAAARMALRANADDAAKIVKAVPANLADDPGLAYERFLWRMRRDLYPEAAQMILSRSGSAAALGQPDAWADKRLSLARYLMRSGSPKDAYRIAASHRLAPDDGSYTDLEFLAGFIALRKLNDPAKALAHFQNLPANGTAITASRRAYWIGRAYDALGKADKARASYQTAAQTQTAFYGLLAAEKLGMALDPALLTNAWPKANIAGTRLAKSSVLDAAVRLAKAGNEQLSGRFLVHLCESLTPAEMGQLAGLSMQMGEYRNAILVAKAAAEKGAIYPGAYYPIPDVVPYDLAVSRALALSIARRESEFDPEATSAVGALGLMQLMPDTAKKQAKDLGLPFDKGRLTSDPGYNVTLGSEYLKGLVDQFGPGVALLAVGYNAGPRRASDWITGFGDPRSASVDVVDWIETIPFNETRTYVMRVAESVVIYRAKLKGKSVPVQIIEELTGR
jgi:soluble lytic murein transglycosylase